MSAFRVQIRNDPGLIDNEGFGQFLPSSMTILLRPDLSADMMRETLAHELEHAFAFVAHLSDGKHDEEAFARRLTPIRLDTYRRNPELRRYLFGGRT